MIGDVPHCLWVRLALLLSTFPARSWWMADSLRGWDMEPTGMGWGCCPGKGKHAWKLLRKVSVFACGSSQPFILRAACIRPVFVSGCILWALDTHLTHGASLLGAMNGSRARGACVLPLSPPPTPFPLLQPHWPPWTHYPHSCLGPLAGLLGFSF